MIMLTFAINYFQLFLFIEWLYKDYEVISLIEMWYIFIFPLLTITFKWIVTS